MPRKKNRTSDKDLNKLLDLAEKSGWTFTEKKGKNNSHIFGVSADGKHTTTVSSTPNTKKPVYETRSILRRDKVKGI